MSKKWVASNYTHPSVPCKHGSKPQMEVYAENSSSASVVSKAPFHMYCLLSSLEPRFEADIITPLWWKFCRNPFSFTMYFSSIIHINVIVLQYDKLKPQELNYWTKRKVCFLNLFHNITVILECRFIYSNAKVIQLRTLYPI